MNKKMLKRSLSALLASVGVSVDMNAMESKKIISMKDFADKDGSIAIYRYLFRQHRRKVH